MFKDIACQLAETNRSRLELKTIEETSFQVVKGSGGGPGPERGALGESCGC